MSKKIFPAISDKIMFTGPKNPKDLLPKCVVQHNKNFNIKAYGFSSEGYLMPCCWTIEEVNNDFAELKKEKLNIKNVEKIEDIINSDEWKNFADILINKPEQAPNLCWFFCSKKERQNEQSIIYDTDGNTKIQGPKA